VLGFCPGGILVAAEVARLLEAPLDAVLVQQTNRFVLTAITGTLDVARNENSTTRKAIGQDEASAAADSSEGIEVARRQQGYRNGRPPANLFGRCVMLIDDGATDGAALKATASAVRLLNLSRIVAATPVDSIESLEQLEGIVNDIVCPWVLSVPASADRAYGLRPAEWWSFSTPCRSVI
jgi:putative phosphoribosyl transferase